MTTNSDTARPLDTITRITMLLCLSWGSWHFPDLFSGVLKEDVK